MANNYESWSRFDEQAELRDTDARFKVEDFKAEAAKSEANSNQEMQKSATTVQREIEAMQSKLRVDALLAKSAPNGAERRRRKKNAMKEQEESDTVSVSSPPIAVTVSGSDESANVSNDDTSRIDSIVATTSKIVNDEDVGKGV